MEHILLSVQNNIARLTINRPKVNNALNEQLILEFTKTLASLHDQKDIRVLVIQAKGKNFCAGADLKWMQKLIDAPQSEHLQDSKKLTSLLEAISDLPIPTLGIVEGATYGGGVGIIAACDIVIAEENSHFCFSEAKLGLVPSIISPYIVKSIGLRQTKKLFLTAEIFTAKQAYQFGLLHQCCTKENLSKTQEEIIQNILSCAPMAVKMIKKLFLQQDLTQKTPELMNTLTNLIAKIRVSEEAQHGMNAFLTKQTPDWSM